MSPVPFIMEINKL